MPDMECVVGLVISMSSPSSSTVSCQDEVESPGSRKRLGQK